MDSKTTRWLAALALSAMLVGCGDKPTWAEKAVETRSPRTAPSAIAPAVTAAAPAATTAPSAAKASAKSAPEASRLAVERLVITTGVEKREPLAETTSFDSGTGRVYAFVEVENPERAEGKVFVSFVPPKGAAHGPIELDVGAAPRWRTWAYTRAATKPGAWKVVVEDAKGKVLAEAEFEVRGAPAAAELPQPGA